MRSVRAGCLGKVGVGSTAPAAKLDVEGSVRIADGTQAAGRVLVSDARGFATWRRPVVETLVVASGWTSGDATAACPPGFKAIGGGGSCRHVGHNLFSSCPSALEAGCGGDSESFVATRWNVSCRMLGLDSVPSQAWAVCAPM